MEGFEQKLFVGKTLEGQKEENLFLIARDIEDQLSRHKGFIGVSPHGSRVKGYATEGSDYDYWILFNPNEAGPEYLDELFQDFELIRERYLAQGIIVSLRKQDVNIDLLQHLSTEDTHWDYICEKIAHLFRSTTGTSITKYRSQLRHSFEQLNDVEKERITKDIIDKLVAEDEIRTDVMVERIPEMEGEEVAYTNDRRRLWEQRVQNILNNEA